MHCLQFEYLYRLQNSFQTIKLITISSIKTGMNHACKGPSLKIVVNVVFILKDLKNIKSIKQRTQQSILMLQIHKSDTNSSGSKTIMS